MKLYLMRLARIRGLDAPVPGYLIQTDDGVNVLVDTGTPKPPPGAPENPENPFLMGEDDYVVNQLARIGVAPEDVRYLVCTHFDGDHAGNHEAFTSAELVVQRSHYQAAKGGLERVQPLRAHWDAPGLRYTEVDGDTELLPGIELIESSGHVPGHQAVLVRLPETGPVVLAIDAIPNAALLDPDTRLITEYDMDEAGVRASTRKLVELAKREDATMIVYGHDPAQWATLRLLPEFYS
jgi:N-acyl homoserine lactone hydrolase